MAVCIASPYKAGLISSGVTFPQQQPNKSQSVVSDIMSEIIYPSRRETGYCLLV